MITFRQAMPSVLTATSLLFGLCSIVSAGMQDLEHAAWFIVWCVLLDIADGPVARVLKATSRFGAEFDSFSDLVAFGLAPAALVLHTFWKIPEVLPPWWVIGPCGLYPLLAAIRLARFNASKPLRPGWFQGVPSTVSGAIVASAVILLLHREHSAAVTNWMPFLLSLLSGLGLAMVSNLPFRRPVALSSRLLNIVLLSNVLGVYFCGVLRIWPEYLFGVAVVVLLGGLGAGLRRPMQV
jgi:CDP-diacylglycerol---serine O-phosphatidyltransferase